MKNSNFMITIALAAGGVWLVNELGTLIPPLLHMKPIVFNPWVLMVMFGSLVLFSKFVFNMFKKLLLFGLLTPVFFGLIHAVCKKMHIESNPTTLWIYRAMALGCASAAYFYGWELIKFLTYKFFWYMFAPMRFLSKTIGPTLNTLFRKVKKLPPCPIDIPLSTIDKFGKGDAYEQGRQFEEYIAQIYRVMGYNAKTTTQLRAEGKLPPSIQARGGSGEQGVDVIVPIYNPQSGAEERIIIQCKHYSKKVDNGAVQEIHSAKAMYNGHLAVVITNNYFTKPAQELAASNGVKLINRDDLAKLIENATKKYYQQANNRKEKPEVKLVA